MDIFKRVLDIVAAAIFVVVMVSFSGLTVYAVLLVNGTTNGLLILAGVSAFAGSVCWLAWRSES